MGKPFGGVGPGPMPEGAYQDPLAMMRGREGLPQQYGNYGQAMQALLQMLPGLMGQQPMGAAPGAMPSAPLTPPAIPNPYTGPAPMGPEMPLWGPAPSVGRVTPGGMRGVRPPPTKWRRKA